VLVIHGKRDEVCDFAHALTIYERCPRALAPLWIDQAGHCNVELYAVYIDRLLQLVNEDLAPSRNDRSISTATTTAAATTTTTTTRLAAVSPEQ